MEAELTEFRNGGATLLARGATWSKQPTRRARVADLVPGAIAEAAT